MTSTLRTHGLTLALAMLPGLGAFAAEAGKLDVTLQGLDKEGYILPDYAYCAPDKEERTRPGGGD